MNGLGAQGGPRGADVPNPVTYPFRGLGGVTIERQHAGERVYDINVDGVAQYGLYPDWIEDLRLVADAQRGDGDAIALDMARGAEAYLQTWERALGVAPDSCRNPGLRLRVATFRDRVEPGLTAREVLREVGQPFLRRDLTFTYCARTARDPDVRLRVVLGRQRPGGGGPARRLTPSVSLWQQGASRAPWSHHVARCTGARDRGCLGPPGGLGRGSPDRQDRPTGPRSRRRRWCRTRRAGETASRSSGRTARRHWSRATWCRPSRAARGAPGLTDVGAPRPRRRARPLTYGILRPARRRSGAPGRRHPHRRRRPIRPGGRPGAGRPRGGGAPRRILPAVAPAGRRGAPGAAGRCLVVGLRDHDPAAGAGSRRRGRWSRALATRRGRRRLRARARVPGGGHGDPRAPGLTAPVGVAGGGRAGTRVRRVGGRCRRAPRRGASTGCRRC